MDPISSLYAAAHDANPAISEALLCIFGFVLAVGLHLYSREVSENRGPRNDSARSSRRKKGAKQEPQEVGQASNAREQQESDKAHQRVQRPANHNLGPSQQHADLRAQQQGSNAQAVQDDTRRNGLDQEQFDRLVRVVQTEANRADAELRQELTRLRQQTEEGLVRERAQWGADVHDLRHRVDRMEGIDIAGLIERLTALENAPTASPASPGPSNAFIAHQMDLAAQEREDINRRITLLETARAPVTTTQNRSHGVGAQLRRTEDELSRRLDDLDKGLSQRLDGLQGDLSETKSCGCSTAKAPAAERDLAAIPKRLNGLEKHLNNVKSCGCTTDAAPEADGGRLDVISTRLDEVWNGCLELHKGHAKICEAGQIVEGRLDKAEAALNGRIQESTQDLDERIGQDTRALGRRLDQAERTLSEGIDERAGSLQKTIRQTEQLVDREATQLQSRTDGALSDLQDAVSDQVEGLQTALGDLAAIVEDLPRCRCLPDCCRARLHDGTKRSNIVRAGDQTGQRASPRVRGLREDTVDSSSITDDAGPEVPGDVEVPEGVSTPPEQRGPPEVIVTSPTTPQTSECRSSTISLPDDSTTQLGEPAEADISVPVHHGSPVIPTSMTPTEDGHQPASTETVANLQGSETSPGSSTLKQQTALESDSGEPEPVFTSGRQTVDTTSSTGSTSAGPIANGTAENPMEISDEETEPVDLPVESDMVSRQGVEGEPTQPSSELVAEPVAEDDEELLSMLTAALNEEAEKEAARHRRGDELADGEQVQVDEHVARPDTEPANPTSPQSTSKVPEEAPGVTGQAPAAPVQESTALKHEPSAPEEVPAAPKQEPAPPKQEHAAPKQETAAPERAPAAPENATAAPPRAAKALFKTETSHQFGFTAPSSASPSSANPYSISSAGPMQWEGSAGGGTSIGFQGSMFNTSGANQVPSQMAPGNSIFDRAGSIGQPTQSQQITPVRSEITGIHSQDATTHTSLRSSSVAIEVDDTVPEQTSDQEGQDVSMIDSDAPLLTEQPGSTGDASVQKPDVVITGIENGTEQRSALSLDDFDMEGAMDKLDEQGRANLIELMKDTSWMSEVDWRQDPHRDKTTQNSTATGIDRQTESENVPDANTGGAQQDDGLGGVNSFDARAFDDNMANRTIGRENMLSTTQQQQSDAMYIEGVPDMKTQPPLPAPSEGTAPSVVPADQVRIPGLEPIAEAGEGMAVDSPPRKEETAYISPPRSERGSQGSISSIAYSEPRSPIFGPPPDSFRVSDRTPSPELVLSDVEEDVEETSGGAGVQRGAAGARGPLETPVSPPEGTDLYPNEPIFLPPEPLEGGRRKLKPIGRKGRVERTEPVPYAKFIDMPITEEEQAEINASDFKLTMEAAGVQLPEEANPTIHGLRPVQDWPRPDNAVEPEHSVQETTRTQVTVQEPTSTERPMQETTRADDPPETTVPNEEDISSRIKRAAEQDAETYRNASATQHSEDEDEGVGNANPRCLPKDRPIAYPKGKFGRNFPTAEKARKHNENIMMRLPGDPKTEWDESSSEESDEDALDQFIREDGLEFVSAPATRPESGSGIAPPLLNVDTRALRPSPTNSHDGYALSPTSPAYGSHGQPRIPLSPDNPFLHLQNQQSRSSLSPYDAFPSSAPPNLAAYGYTAFPPTSPAQHYGPPTRSNTMPTHGYQARPSPTSPSMSNPEANPMANPSTRPVYNPTSPIPPGSRTYSTVQPTRPGNMPMRVSPTAPSTYTRPPAGGFSTSPGAPTIYIPRPGIFVNSQTSPSASTPQYFQPSAGQGLQTSRHAARQPAMATVPEYREPDRPTTQAPSHMLTDHGWQEVQGINVPKPPRKPVVTIEEEKAEKPVIIDDEVSRAFDEMEISKSKAEGSDDAMEEDDDSIRSDENWDDRLKRNQEKYSPESTPAPENGNQQDVDMKADQPTSQPDVQQENKQESQQNADDSDDDLSFEDVVIPGQSQVTETPEGDVFGPTGIRHGTVDARGYEYDAYGDDWLPPVNVSD